MTTFSSTPPAIAARRRAVDLRPFLFKLGIVLVSVVVLVLAARQHARTAAFGLLWHHSAGRPLLIAGGIYAGLTTVWSVWRLFLSLCYRPTPVAALRDLPRISVIVPAFNEAGLIANTLRHLAGAAYPAERLEIIVVDDGSTDGTWEQIQRAAAGGSGAIRPIRLPSNRGKRHALYEGFQRATGDVLVTVDSDSLIEANALRELVSPLVADSRVGAVAGNVRVLNKQDGLIPRMLDVRYVMTFDYKRAAQSVMGGGGVLCVAGALAAYRREAVRPVLEAWLNQTWLGCAARAGEDHAMTNFILRQGYAVKFQRTARVRTQCPTTYGGLARMFLRWGRSNVRETVHLATFLFDSRMHAKRTRKTVGQAPLPAITSLPARATGETLDPSASQSSFGRRLATRGGIAMQINYLVGATGLIVPYLFLTAAIVSVFTWPSVFGLKMLAACVTGGVFPMLFYAVHERDDEALMAIPYSFYAMFLLCWVWPYALLTSHKSVWMTRDSSHGSSA